MSPLLTALFVVSFACAYDEKPKYLRRDAATSKVLLCDQCPPGTAVERHCTANQPTLCSRCPEKSFTEQWHWGENCQHCTSVCKERQVVQRECNSTQNRVCQCSAGYHLLVEFCVQHTACPPGFGVSEQGTAVKDTVCERCSRGHFSSAASSTDACLPHRDCTHLGLKTLRAGTSTQDTRCGSDVPELSIDCSHQHRECQADFTLCEEALFHFLTSPLLASVPVEHLAQSLPGRRVDWKSVEWLKKSCSPQQQTVYLLRLWREQNKDQGKLFGIVEGVNHCERKVSRCASVKNITLADLLVLTESLPGEKVRVEDIRALVQSCPSQRYILQLLHLWKIRNVGHDLTKALSRSLRQLRSSGARHALLRTLKRIKRVISTTFIHRMYEKMIVNMIKDNACFKAKAYND